MFLTSDLVCCFHGCENRFEVLYVFLFFLFSISNFAPFKFLVFKDLDTNEGYTILIYFFKFFQIFSNKFHFARALDSFSFNLFFHSRINSYELRISFDFLRQKFRAFSTRSNILISVSISIETDHKSRKKISPVLYYLQ